MGETRRKFDKNFREGAVRGGQVPGVIMHTDRGSRGTPRACSGRRASGFADTETVRAPAVILAGASDLGEPWGERRDSNPRHPGPQQSVQLDR